MDYTRGPHERRFRFNEFYNSNGRCKRFLLALLFLYEIVILNISSLPLKSEGIMLPDYYLIKVM
jgi:hypothetical protein